VTTFTLWAPHAKTVDLVLDGQRLAMTRAGDHWTATADGIDYGFSLDRGPVLPDPRTRWQPEGVHGLSRVYDDEAFLWTDHSWRPRPLEDSVLYELHVGTFTAGGTFDSAIERLPHLAELGITTVELMPCNAFDGQVGWGYDGVCWFAVHAPYGGPEGLKRFVDAAHRHGLGVAMDVVWNHFGPSGNYLPQFAPYLTDTHHTPWGAAVNLAEPEVRHYLRDNALMWLQSFHLDGLRLDAVHALIDDSPTHVLQEIAAAVGNRGWLVAESDLNDPVVLTQWGMDGQWCDDVHHALFALLTGERDGYYGDFGSLATLAKALTSAFVHDGTWSSFRGRPHGAPVPFDVPGWRFVVYLQDHDQVGNRALGDRPNLSPGLQRIGAAIVLLSPFTPMLFMGQEYGEQAPFQFFSDHSGDIGEAVRRGRRAEFASHGWATEEVPDPQDPTTVAASTLTWDLDGDLLTFYRAAMALRPRVSRSWREQQVSFDEQQRWLTMRRGDVLLACNLSGSRRQIPVASRIRASLLENGDWSLTETGLSLGPESLVVLELAESTEDELMP
jgi:maltooligosyltrehalose trehalohydrolase